MIAYATHHLHRRGRKGRLLPGIGVGAIYAVALTVLADALLNKISGISFYQLLRQGDPTPATLFISGGAIGVIYEYVGSVALGQWYYPTVRHRRRLALFLIFFWAFFMLIMQDTYAIFRALGLGSTFAFVLTALIPFALLEGINVYTRTWVYQRQLKSVHILIAGWFLMTYTFVLAFNTYVVNPFGY